MKFCVILIFILYQSKSSCREESCWW